MLLDPVTGETNTNPKKQPNKKSKVDDEAVTKKISKQDKYLEFRPLKKFHSKLLGSTRRLSVFPSFCVGR